MGLGRTEFDHTTSTSMSVHLLLTQLTLQPLPIQNALVILERPIQALAPGPGVLRLSGAGPGPGHRPR